MQDINEIKRKIERDLGIKVEKLNKIINTEIIPLLREELRKENEAKVEEMLAEMEFQHEEYSMFGVQNCTKLERMRCQHEITKIVILDLLAQGWIINKKIFNSDIWNGKLITKRLMGGRTILP